MKLFEQIKTKRHLLQTFANAYLEHVKEWRSKEDVFTLHLHVTPFYRKGKGNLERWLTPFPLNSALITLAHKTGLQLPLFRLLYDSSRPLSLDESKQHLLHPLAPVSHFSLDNAVKKKKEKKKREDGESDVIDIPDLVLKHLKEDFERVIRCYPFWFSFTA